MKTPLTLIIILLNFSICTAQRVTYRDVIFVLNHNIAETEDFLSNKGFEFNKVDTLKGQLEQVCYSFSKNSKNNNQYIGLEKKSVKDIFYEVSMFTVLQSDYLKIKSSIKKEGYKLSSTKTNNGELQLVFKKGEIEITFSTSYKPDIEMTDYYISFTNTKKQEKAWELSK